MPSQLPSKEGKGLPCSHQFSAADSLEALVGPMWLGRHIASIHMHGPRGVIHS